ncbi:hypothetical protein B2G88_16715 [Natronolimnobius baerhuensis]|uniref:Uncharacterized protein n=1 Tax=Natronolimnobius baerhuensis TaxID=253108 RepID=A0A202E4E6_9EURY|nr:hypothetical protein B2G88_16715 [Natronolimnobius baerhuensis]
MVQPAVVVPPEPDDRWTLATQLGVTDAVIHPLETAGRTVSNVGHNATVLTECSLLNNTLYSDISGYIWEPSTVRDTLPA